MRHHKQLCRPIGELCKMCYKNNMMVIELHYCFIAHTTGTTKTVHTAQVLVIAGQEESDSTISRTSKTFFCNIKTRQFVVVFYLMFIPCASITCSLNMFRAVCRLVVVSPALNTDSKSVPFIELGCLVFTN